MKYKLKHLKDGRRVLMRRRLFFWTVVEVFPDSSPAGINAAAPDLDNSEFDYGHDVDYSENY